jgi:hypothetical protein
MIGALIVIATILGFIASELRVTNKALHRIEKQIEAVTTTAKDFLGRDILVIRTKADS